MSGATKLLTAGGGGVSLTPASSIASDVTVNVPTQNCTLGIQGPAFSAYPNSNQSISTNTWTKISLQTKEFDTASAFDNTTNYRFQPLVAGYYQINAVVYPNTTTSFATTALYKNGANYKAVQTAANSVGTGCSALIYFNGTTDYIELYTFITGTSPVVFGSGTYTFLNGSMVRAA